MEISSEETGQTPLLMVQRSTLMPGESPETVVVLEPALAKVPVPETTVQIPAPTTAPLAAKVVDVAHTD